MSDQSPPRPRDDLADLKKLHGKLDTMFEGLLVDCRPLLGGAGTDTAFAIGFAAGEISKAKALVGRDIDDEMMRAAAIPPSTGS